MSSLPLVSFISSDVIKRLEGTLSADEDKRMEGGGQGDCQDCAPCPCIVSCVDDVTSERYSVVSGSGFLLSVASCDHVTT